MVVALSVSWWLNRGLLLGVVATAEKQAAESEVERATWERMTQMGAVAHNETLRVIEESGLVIVSRGGKR